ncbi:hypothetical protein K0504_09995 [Neiella marina]|uniref:Thiol:disulfide interchange protein n=1 Tax=Neiella holothuriorum TaxID=2870530 RepID=A0ABS7EGN5_9GAMM|nr:hypothetical protein [Neiella holothuriorum]MBW8191369.1 hypothetical protein [Neiella holothuriorum]
MRRFAGVALLASFLMCPVTYADEAPKESADAQPKLTFQPFPTTNGLALVETEDGEVQFVTSNNARFAIQGKVWDSWTKRYINTLDDLLDSLHVPLAQIGIHVEQMAHLKLGNHSKSRLGVVFIDPLSVSSREFLKRMSATPNKYRFDVVLVPTQRPGSLEEAQRLWCSPDKGAALSDLLNNTKNAPASKDESSCNIQALIKSSIALNMLNIKTVPHIVREDGLMALGVPTNFDQWLVKDFRKKDQK